MNIRQSQRVYRAPFLYVAQYASAPKLIRLGHTLRPAYELQRLEQRHGAPMQLIAHVRAYTVLTPILCRRFAYVCAGGQWFEPDRRLMLLAGMFRLRGPDNLITADALRSLFAVVFPDSPYAGIADYRIAEAYIKSCRMP